MTVYFLINLVQDSMQKLGITIFIYEKYTQKIYKYGQNSTIVYYGTEKPRHSLEAVLENVI